MTHCSTFVFAVSFWPLALTWNQSRHSSLTFFSTGSRHRASDISVIRREFVSLCCARGARRMQGRGSRVTHGVHTLHSSSSKATLFLWPRAHPSFLHLRTFSQRRETGTCLRSPPQLPLHFRARSARRRRAAPSVWPVWLTCQAPPSRCPSTAASRGTPWASRSSMRCLCRRRALRPIRA